MSCCTAPTCHQGQNSGLSADRINLLSCPSVHPFIYPSFIFPSSLLSVFSFILSSILPLFLSLFVLPIYHPSIHPASQQIFVLGTALGPPEVHGPTGIDDQQEQSSGMGV